MKRVLLVLLFLLASTGLLLLWMAGGAQSPRTFEERPNHLEGIQAHTSTDTRHLAVLTWNIAWGYGFGSEGTGKARPKVHFDQSVRRIGEVIKTLNPDIVLLQEVDFAATRSHHVDQARTIAAEAGLPYVASAPSWEANWIPFPYWPPSEHFGHMKSGGAILSRFPITANTVTLLEKPAENPWWWNLFYLFRYLQRVEIQVGDQKMQVFNTHLEAFSAPNRILQAEMLQSVLKQSMSPLTLLGGDFNTVPPESTVKTGYPDEPATNNTNDRTIEIFRAIPGLRDVIPKDVFAAAQEKYFTFPSHAANRKLDYLFAGEGFDVLDARVAAEAGGVSDHLPVLAHLELKSR